MGARLSSKDHTARLIEMPLATAPETPLEGAMVKVFWQFSPHRFKIGSEYRGSILHGKFRKRLCSRFSFLKQNVYAAFRTMLLEMLDVKPDNSRVQPVLPCTFFLTG